MNRGFGGGFGASRQQEKVKTLLIVSVLVCVLCGSVGAMFIFSGSEEVKTVDVIREPRLDTVNVLVPVKQIEPGTTLDSSLFKFEARPKAGLSARAITSLEKVQGMYARSLIVPDQPIVEDYVTRVKPNSAITANIPEGFRAVTIRVDARSSVEGWARPGARVDVVWSTVIRGKQAVNTIVQNAKVLSAERQTEGQQNNNSGAENGVPNTCTLLVSAEDANKIQLASTAGSLSLSLRGDRPDVELPKNQRAITIDDLIANADDTNKPPVDEGPTIRVKQENGQYTEYLMKGGKLVPKKSREPEKKEE